MAAATQTIPRFKQRYTDEVRTGLKVQLGLGNILLTAPETSTCACATPFSPASDSPAPTTTSTALGTITAQNGLPRQLQLAVKISF